MTERIHGWALVDPDVFFCEKEAATKKTERTSAWKKWHTGVKLIMHEYRKQKKDDLLQRRRALHTCMLLDEYKQHELADCCGNCALCCDCAREDEPAPANPRTKFCLDSFLRVEGGEKTGRKKGWESSPVAFSPL